MRRIGVIGTFVWDTIWHPSLGAGQPLEQWGGVAYSLAAFSAASPPGFEIVPIIRVGHDLADAAIAFTESLPNVRTGDEFRPVPEPNNRVELRYRGSAERSERLTGGVSPWAAGELLPLLESVDALYVNFLSGFEIDLDTSERLKEVGVPIYADLHSLFLGPPGDGPRRPRRLREWRRWLGCFDAVQLNELELGLLGPARSDLFEPLAGLPRLGPLAVFVTRGAEGATYVSRPGADDPFSWPALRADSRWGRETDLRGDSPLPLCTVPTGSSPAVGDPTGCGDVWGSVLFASLCGGHGLPAAIRRAHAAAVAKLRERRVERVPAAIRSALAEIE